MAKRGNSGPGSHQPPYDEDAGDEDGLPEELSEGVALFPDTPAELGVDPVLLSLLNCVVFLCGSNEEIVHPGAANLVMDQVMTAFSRLSGERLIKVREDMDVLVAWAKDQGLGKGAIEFLETFFDEMGVGGGQ